MTAQVPKALAFGDSVMWGQGIKHKNKFATLIAKNILGFSFSEANMLAHSGAKLGKKNDRDPIALDIQGEPLNGEIPIGSPTIFSQIATYIPGFREGLDDGSQAQSDIFPEVSVVFLNGGINDLGASKIITGDFGSRRDFERVITPIFHEDTLILLRFCRVKFPNAQLMLFGYHFIFSQFSFESFADTVDDIEGFIDGFPSVKASAFRRVYRRAARQGSLFMSITHTLQQRAIDTFNAEDHGVGSLFIPTLHGQQHAAFAPSSLSWGLRNPTPNSISSRNFLKLTAIKTIVPNHSVSFGLPGISDDEVASHRATICNLNVADIGERSQCVLAGLFHPNSASASRVEKTTAHVHSAYTGRISIREIVGRASIGTYMQELGFNNRPSVRNMFATNVISAVQLNATVLAGSDGDFPYHLMHLKLHLLDGATVRMDINSILRFSQFVEELDKDLFPGAVGPLASSSSGNFHTIRDVEQDTDINFHAFPTKITDIHHVKKIELGCKPTEGRFNVQLENIELKINGRILTQFNKNIIVTLGDGQEIVIFLPIAHL